MEGNRTSTRQKSRNCGFIDKEEAAIREKVEKPIIGKGERTSGCSFRPGRGDFVNKSAIQPRAGQQSWGCMGKRLGGREIRLIWIIPLHKGGNAGRKGKREQVNPRASRWRQSDSSEIGGH